MWSVQEAKRMLCMTWANWHKEEWISFIDKSLYMFLHLLKSDPLELSLNSIKMLTETRKGRVYQNIFLSMAMFAIYFTVDKKE